MTTPGTPELVVGSVSSVYSIRDTIESCQCAQQGHPSSSALSRSCLIALFNFIDRRSQLLSSTARVVSARPRTNDEPSLADDHEETSGARTPQTAFVHDLYWDEDDPVVSTYTSPQRPVRVPNESRRVSEVQAPTWRSQHHASADERSPLLSREVSEAIPAAPRRSPNSVPPKSVVFGQSTFSQTVRDRICLFFSPEFMVFWLAFQCHRLVTWHWHAL